jgi:hypothetical protein
MRPQERKRSRPRKAAPHKALPRRRRPVEHDRLLDGAGGDEPQDRWLLERVAEDVQRVG